MTTTSEPIKTDRSMTVIAYVVVAFAGGCIGFIGGLIVGLMTGGCRL